MTNKLRMQNDRITFLDKQMEDFKAIITARDEVIEELNIKKKVLLD